MNYSCVYCDGCVDYDMRILTIVGNLIMCLSCGKLNMALDTRECRKLSAHEHKQVGS